MLSSDRPDSIDDRKEQCEDRPDKCQDEAWYCHEFNAQLREKLQTDKDLSRERTGARQRSEMRPNNMNVIFIIKVW